MYKRTHMEKRVRISNNSLNSYGTRVLTSGMDTTQYERNPVLLYMHERGKVIGYVKDLRPGDDEITAELVFDCASELSERCKKQWEFGSLRMVSVGIDIIEMSEDKKYLVPGQTSPTITKSKLYEVSVVDIGANDDAIVLRKNGKKITFGRDGECPLPLLNNKINNMENKTIALKLGLPETATDAEISAKISELHAAKEQKETLQKEVDELTLGNIVILVDAAILEKRIMAADRQQFIDLGKKIGKEDLSKMLKTISPRVKLTETLGHQGGVPSAEDNITFTKLSEVSPSQLVVLRKENPVEYKRLYKAEYGIECEL